MPHASGWVFGATGRKLKTIYLAGVLASSSAAAPRRSQGESAMSSAAAREFLRKAVVKSADLEHRATIQRAVTSYDAAVAKGKLRFADWEAARTLCAAIKADAIANLAQYLTEFEQQVTARGGHVHWAENAEQANDYVVELAKARNVKTVVKSKSMVTEEIHLAAALEKIGVTVWETDLGEFIVQLRHELTQVGLPYRYANLFQRGGQVNFFGDHRLGFDDGLHVSRFRPAQRRSHWPALRSQPNGA